uniref:Ig-like domain-containing protein n=1 Tax=Anabas testudineus TaxID=64144 RepID=A0A3Q1I6W4_ANATE
MSFSALVFHCTVILLLLTDSCESQEAGSSQTVTALVGEDVILPCLLEPAADVISKSLEWGRLDLEPRFVHVWHEGQNLLVNQNPAYRGRTSLSTEKLKHGDLSLSLSALKHSDNGQYRCYFPSQGKTSTVELLVGSVSSPVIAEININSSIVVLQCESKGWYPEPDLLWLDAEGKILSAGPTKTVRGPDDLYTVSSTVTVEKRHSNNITCRVQQSNINQTRESQIKVTGDCLTHEIIIVGSKINTTPFTH